MDMADRVTAATPQRRAGQAGRRQRVHGGFPVVRQVALTIRDGERLAALASQAGMSEGGYAACVVEQHLRARWDDALPLGTREALGEVVARSAEVASMVQELAGIGRLVNQIARHVNVHGVLPPGSSLARIEREISIARTRVVAQIRAKARRIKARHNLDLIVVDYLQLMTSGRRAENRQVEVSEFSRQLKISPRRCRSR